MLEWYRPAFDMFQLIDEVGDLLQEILKIQAVTKVSYQEAFQKYLHIDLFNTPITELHKLALEHGYYNDGAASFNDSAEFLFSMIIQPQLGKDNPVAIYNFPASMAALARLNPNNPLEAERFEIYYQGIELCNGFNELTDYALQQSRFTDDNLAREKLGLPTYSLDTNFLTALQHGMPQTSGVALGLDRLFMLACNVASLDEIISFSIIRA